MNAPRRTLPLWIAASLGLIGTASLHAQTAPSNSADAASGTTTQAAQKTAPKKSGKPPSNAVTLGTITVTGTRGSLESSEARKRYADQMLDSIVASDIGKLPDTNVADALQRVTGVQVTQDSGEGQNVAIRGSPRSRPSSTATPFSPRPAVAR
jgi:Outer membrane cobalamin receptor protein